jgi:hypothetical protein
MKKKLLIVTLFVGALVYACEEKRQSGSTDTLNTNTKISLSIDSTPFGVLKAKRDSADKAWTIMIASDDQKISYNALLLDSLTLAVKGLKEKRYVQLTMTGDQIDNYDLATDKIIARTKFLARTTEELKSHPIAETLYNDIAKADNDVALYRSLYDRFAMEYNDLLEKSTDSLNEQTAEFKKYPVFSIGV